MNSFLAASAAAARDPAAASRDDARARDRRATPSSLPSDEASLLQEERDALRSAYELVVAERDDARESATTRFRRAHPGLRTVRDATKTKTKTKTKTPWNDGSE